MSRIKRLGFGVAAAALIGASVLPAFAQPMLEIWNTAACRLTDAATFTVDRPIKLDRIELWYNWRSNETAAPYTALIDNEVAFSGTLVRAACDQYQRAWCVARAEPGMILPPGAYTFRTRRTAICQNAGSGDQGFLRVFGSPVEITPPPAPPPADPSR